MATAESLQTKNAGMCVEGRETSYTIAEMRIDTATMENTMEIP